MSETGSSYSPPSETGKKQRITRRGVLKGVGGALGTLALWRLGVRHNETAEQNQIIADIAEFQNTIKSFFKPSFDPPFWESVNTITSRNDIKKNGSKTEPGLQVLHLTSLKEADYYDQQTPGDKDKTQTGPGVLFRFNRPNNGTIIRDIRIEKRETGFEEIYYQTSLEQKKLLTGNQNSLTPAQMHELATNLLVISPDNWETHNEKNVATLSESYIQGKIRKADKITTYKVDDHGLVTITAIPLPRLQV